mmetsp:Transcript_14107/g.48628  ORF Transcript_14107/g.48628 Transcript_14107/m.48628 type:complete len:226 (-) Transcript_14107:794-1471(-)
MKSFTSSMRCRNACSVRFRLKIRLHMLVMPYAKTLAPHVMLIMEKRCSQSVTGAMYDPIVAIVMMEWYTLTTYCVPTDSCCNPWSGSHHSSFSHVSSGSTPSGQTHLPDKVISLTHVPLSIPSSCATSIHEHAIQCEVRATKKRNFMMVSMLYLSCSATRILRRMRANLATRSTLSSLSTFSIRTSLFSLETPCWSSSLFLSTKGSMARSTGNALTRSIQNQPLR